MAEFHKKILENGLTVVFEKREVPVTTVMLATKFGAAYESEEEKGIAHFIEHLCFKGTEKRSVKEIAETLEKVGGSVNAFTSEEETAYHVKLPSRHLDLAMDVIFDVFFNPTFPEEEIAKEANVICEEIKMYHDNPSYHVLEKIKSCLYGNPFGLFIAGSEETVRGLKREKLLKKHREVYCTENAILSVVGNNNFEEVLELAEKFSFKRDFVRPELKKISLKQEQEVEKRSNLQQSHIAIGLHFPKASDREIYAAEVFSAILGEGMSSKLFSEVREKRGLAYAVKSMNDSGKNYGYFMIYIGTDKEKEKEVIKISMEEFGKMSEISDDELRQGKEQAIGNYEVESEDCSSVALQLILNEISGKAEEYYDYWKYIESVSIEEIRELAKKVDFSYFILSSG